MFALLPPPGGTHRGSASKLRPRKLQPTTPCVRQLSPPPPNWPPASTRSLQLWRSWWPLHLVGVTQVRRQPKQQGLWGGRLPSSGTGKGLRLASRRQRPRQWQAIARPWHRRRRWRERVQQRRRHPKVSHMGESSRRRHRHRPCPRRRLCHLRHRRRPRKPSVPRCQRRRHRSCPLARRAPPRSARRDLTRLLDATLTWRRCGTSHEAPSTCKARH